MAFIVLTEDYPDIKVKHPNFPVKNANLYSRFVHWSDWRVVVPGTPDDPPSEIAPALWSVSGIYDLRGTDNLILAVTTEVLTTAGLLTDVTDWQGELWVLCGPPDEAQWCRRLDVSTGPMGDESWSSPPIQTPGVWYGMFRISSITGPVKGELLVGARRL